MLSKRGDLRKYTRVPHLLCKPCICEGQPIRPKLKTANFLHMKKVKGSGGNYLFNCNLCKATVAEANIKNTELEITITGPNFSSGFA